MTYQNSQGEIENLVRPKFTKQIELIINTIMKKKKAGPDGFTSEFQQMFKEEMMTILHNLFQKTEAERKLANSFYKNSTTLMSKKDITRKKLQIDSSHKH